MKIAPHAKTLFRAETAPIGGFFGRHAPDDATSGSSLLATWVGGRRFAAFVNARSAFAALAAMFPRSDIWLPAFICDHLAQPAFAGRTNFYPVLEGFEPDLERVISEAAPASLVLVVSYFGLPIGDDAWRTLARRPDLHVVEDRAQALGAGADCGRGWRLHSPRKLLGVADGGLLVACDAACVLPGPVGAADSEALWRPPQMRADDLTGRRNTLWHSANQAKEAAMAVTSEPMTDLSRSILSATSYASLAAPRMANWLLLDSELGAWSALPADPKAPPLGYVLSLPPALRDRVLHALHAQRIFAAVHWPRIAAPPDLFPREAQWRRELITLPCDHRYGAEDMVRVAAAVKAIL
ncbi:MAG: DegT/DnrJ/EryC1/StrS family aminotransferase [Caulobacteraceae bacterium]